MWIYAYMLSFFLGKYPEVKSMDYMICETLDLKKNKTAMLFHRVCIIYICTSSVWEFQLLHIVSNTWYGHSLILAILMVRGGISLWFLICFPLMTTDDEHFFMS